jgi:hypothetical protein
VQYDLLTAALMGIAIGAGITYLLRQGPGGRRPVVPALLGAGRGAAWAGRHAARLGKRGARWAADEAEELWERVPRKEISRQVRQRMSDAQEVIDDVVSHELDDLRRAIRRQRKRLGV